MKKKYFYRFLIACACSLSLGLHAQHTYEFLLEYPTCKWTANAVEDQDGCIITIISERDGVEYAPNELTEAYTLKFSPGGDTTVRHYNFGDTIFNFSNISKLSGDRFLICGWSKIKDTDQMFLILMEIDNNLNPIWIKQHSFTGNISIGFKDLFIFENEYILPGSILEPPGGAFKPCFLKINKQGNINNYSLWDEYYTGRNGYLLSPDSSKIWMFASGIAQVNGAGWHVFDTSFNYLYGNQLPMNNWDIFHAKWAGPDNFILNYQARRPGATYQDDEVFLSKFDANQNHLYANYFGNVDTNDVVPKYLTQMDFIHPDSIYFGGLTNEYWGNPSPNAKSWIMVGQTDSLLQPRFIHYIGGDKYYRTYYIIATRDGGCFVCAAVWKPDDYIYDLLFLKFNNEGLIVGETPPGMIIKKALVYPNPAQNVLHVETALRNATLQIIDTQGRPVHNERLQGKNLTIDVSGFRPGTYVYTISNRDGEIEQGKFIKN